MTIDMNQALACLCGSKWFVAAVVVDSTTRKLIGVHETVACKLCGNELTVNSAG